MLLLKRKENTYISRLTEYVQIRLKIWSVNIRKKKNKKKIGHILPFKYMSLFIGFNVGMEFREHTKIHLLLFNQKK